MALHGGFAGKGLTGFTKTEGLKLRPPISDPLFAIRRLLCLQPKAEVVPPPGPPPTMVIWIPEIIDEDLIITEPWDDIVTLNVFTYTGNGDIVSGGTATTSSEEPPLFFSVYSENSDAYLTLQLEGWGTDSMGASHLYTFPTDVHAVNIYGAFYMDAP